MSKSKAKSVKSLIKVSHWREHQAREVLDCWEQSGLNMRQFSREFGIGYKRLQYWRKRIQVSNSPVEFIEVIPTPSQSLHSDDSMEIIFSNHRAIRVSPGFNESAIRRLIGIVEG
jgi:hypothetical protein